MYTYLYQNFQPGVRAKSSWLRTFTPFLVVIMTFRPCFLTYDALLLAQTSPRNYRFSQQLVSTIIYHSYKLWPRKVVRNLPYQKQSNLRTAAQFTQVIYCNISAFSDMNSDNHQSRWSFQLPHLLNKSFNLRNYQEFCQLTDKNCALGDV